MDNVIKTLNQQIDRIQNDIDCNNKTVITIETRIAKDKEELERIKAATLEFIETKESIQRHIETISG